jgi:hypothetical protein
MNMEEGAVGDNTVVSGRLNVDFFQNRQFDLFVRFRPLTTFNRLDTTVEV